MKTHHTHPESKEMVGFEKKHRNKKLINFSKLSPKLEGNGYNEFLQNSQATPSASHNTNMLQYMAAMMSAKDKSPFLKNGENYNFPSQIDALNNQNNNNGVSMPHYARHKGLNTAMYRNFLHQQQLYQMALATMYNKNSNKVCVWRTLTIG